MMAIVNSCQQRKRGLCMRRFDQSDRQLCEQFQNTEWLLDSGVSPEELVHCYQELMDHPKGYSKAILKARTFDLIARKARIAVDKTDIFQDKLFSGDLMKRQRGIWQWAVKTKYLPEETAETKKAWDAFGAFLADTDFGHTSPNTRLLLHVGFIGLLERVEMASQRHGLSEKQLDFYESCKIVLRAMMAVAQRLAKAIRPYSEENYEALSHIAEGAPKNSYEAMQLLVLYFFLHEYVAGTRVRTLGRLDVLLYPFYHDDLRNGTYTKAEIKEMLKFFLHKFWSAWVPSDLPFCLGGMDADGNDVTNEVSYLIVETYNELNIYSPKIHIRVSEQTPPEFIKLVLSCIRGGNSSFVFVNDRIGIKSLMDAGISEREARDFVPIGCYEPAVWGVEIGCTGNGGVNLAKAVELVFTGGKDFRSGEPLGIQTGVISSFEAFLEAVKQQIRFMTDRAVNYIVELEKHYDEINPDPILSCQYEHSVQTGVDVYEGGAKYNNSSLYFYSIASLTDAICAVKRLVFEEKRLSFDALGEILKNNWAGQEKLRAKAKSLPEKYGNNHSAADAIAVEMSNFVASLVNNRSNGRGGVFKAALFSIDFCFFTGSKTMATPDGRLAGEPLSKNLCAVTGMDRRGITALINSVTKMDHSKFSTGSVLDVVLHPSAVYGDDGLDAFYNILMTYFQKGGFAMHGNVFQSEDLKKAQKEPEKYKNLQVRVCGWNAYFVNLSKAEQDAFIRQAENAAL